MLRVRVRKKGHAQVVENLVHATSLCVGRAWESDLVLDDESVSRRHCRVWSADDTLMIEDLGSRHGTFLNGQRLEKAALLSRFDEIAVGHFLITVKHVAHPSVDEVSWSSRSWRGAYFHETAVVRPKRPRKKKRSRSNAPETPGARGGDDRTAWEILGVTPGATAAEAKAAYRRLVAQYHPDKVAHLGPELRALAEERTRELTEAWSEVEEEIDAV